MNSIYKIWYNENEKVRSLSITKGKTNRSQADIIWHKSIKMKLFSSCFNPTDHIQHIIRILITLDLSY